MLSNKPDFPWRCSEKSRFSLVFVFNLYFTYFIAKYKYLQLTIGIFLKSEHRVFEISPKQLFAACGLRTKNRCSLNPYGYKTTAILLYLVYRRKLSRRVDRQKREQTEERKSGWGCGSRCLSAAVQSCNKAQCNQRSFLMHHRM